MDNAHQTAISERDSTLTLFETEESRNLPEKTFPVFGIPRGGTTAVTGVIRMLSVFMGDGLPVNLEDPKFSRPGTIKRELVEGRNAEHGVWGWKFPNAANYLDALAPALRNPRYICVTRDLAANGIAIASRHQNFDRLRALDSVIQQAQKNLSYLLRHQKPALLVSYEKLLMSPEATVREIARFLAIDVSEEAIGAATNFVEPGVYRPVDESEGVRG